MMYLPLVLSGILSVTLAVDNKFPSNFLFGASTSAYQIEGGWNASGKGESLWDDWVHRNPDRIVDKSNGDVSADSYHQWHQDVAACVKMGLHFYRFSVSWSRVLPTGFSNQINEAGVAYYNNLINKLLENNIEPMGTLYQFDLPKHLQDLGGWTNPLIVDWFASYAEVVFSVFADRVKYWITINEPAVICELTYSPFLAPCIKERVMAPYICNKNVLLAHAKAWRVYDEKFKPKYGGRVALVNHLLWLEPADESVEQVTELAREFLAGRYSHPIYSKEGGWPPKVESYVAEMSMREGHKNSKLPRFTDKEKELVRGTYDFYGLNHYTSRVVRKRSHNEDSGLWFVTGSSELDIVLESHAAWQSGASAVLPIYPTGIRKQLAWLKKKYGNVDMIVTENGYSSFDSGLNDHKRMKFIHDFLEQILLSIKIDRVNVVGYSYWSLIDSFEWMDGYSLKFGLYNVEFNDPNRPRIPRNSAKYFSSIIKSNTLVDPVAYLKQLHHKERYKLKETRRQNGGHSGIQNGCFTLNIVTLFIITLYS